MRTLSTLLALAMLLLIAAPAGAEDRDPSPAELAAMILEGGPAEQALVAAWLEDADRAELRAVFAAIRAHRAANAAPEVTRLQPVSPGRVLPAPEADRALVNAEVRILEVPVEDAAALLGAARPTAECSHHLLDAAAVKRLLEAAEAHETAAQIAAPRVTVFDGQAANVSLINQVAYIEDYEVGARANDTVIVDPVIATVQEGIVIDFTPTCSEDGRRIRVAFEGTFSSLQRPIKEQEIEFHGQKVKVQLPQVEVGRIRETVDLPAGGWVLLGGGVTFQPREGGPRVERVALLHVTRIDPTDR